MAIMRKSDNPFDRLIMQELSETPISYEDFQQAIDDVLEEPSCEEILREKGLQAEDVLRDAMAYRKAFHEQLAAQGLPVYDRFNLCRLLAEKAQANQSEELRHIFCGILCDPGFLLNHEEQPEDDEDARDIEEQTISQYLSFLPKQEKTLHTLADLRNFSARFSVLQKQKNSPLPGDCSTQLCQMVFQRCTEILELPEDCGALLENLQYYMRIAAASPELSQVQPLFLFLLVTRHQARMCGNPGTEIQLSTLWKRHETKIDTDNGRNFKTCILYLQLFYNLCEIFEKEETVDLPFCWYCLDRLTSLGDFYRQNCSDEDELPFPPTVRELAEDAFFTCFEYGDDDNLLLADGGVTSEKLYNFEASENPRIHHMLGALSDYINANADELTERYIGKSLPEIKALCADIVNSAKLSPRRQPKNMQEMALVLASINGGMMELQDDRAIEYLIAAGASLTEGSELTE